MFRVHTLHIEVALIKAQVFYQVQIIIIRYFKADEETMKSFYLILKERHSHTCIFLTYILKETVILSYTELSVFVLVFHKNVLIFITNEGLAILQLSC